MPDYINHDSNKLPNLNSITHSHHCIITKNNKLFLSSYRRHVYIGSSEDLKLENWFITSFVKK